MQSKPMSQKYSQIAQLSQSGQWFVGDGNSLRNQLAVQSMRDISTYDVKKVKFVDSTEKENIQ
jgi:hypothetical protein